jgi:hypothetical protein
LKCFFFFLGGPAKKIAVLRVWFLVKASLLRSL